MFTVIVSTDKLTLVSTYETWAEAFTVSSVHVGFARRVTIKQDGIIVATIKSYVSSVQARGLSCKR